MSVRTDVLLWAQRVLARSDAAPHVLLEVREGATPEQISDAFQKIARMAHPDLHRAGLSPEELELVTSAYSRVAGAYQEMRSNRMATTKIKPLAAGSEPQGIVAQRLSGGIKAQTPTAGVAVPEKKPGADMASSSMSSKALIYYRKAELALRRGDLRGGILQLKMAIAADPASQFLRSALTEVEAELAKKP